MTEAEAKKKLCPHRCGWESTDTYDKELEAYCRGCACSLNQVPAATV